MHFSIISLALVLAAGAANAASVNNMVVRAACGSNLFVDTRISSPEIGALGVTAGPPANSEANCSAGANAFAGAGVARVTASIVNPGDDDSPVLIRGEASAFAQLSYDLRILAPITNPDPFDFSINMNATGSIGAFSRALFSDTGAFLNSGQIISAGLTASGSLRTQNDRASFEETISVRVNPDENDNASLSGAFTTPSILVRPGEIVTVTFGLSGGTSGQLFGQAASGNVMADRSLSFATDRNVFNLPDGYSVQIDEPRLIGNRYFTPEMELPGDDIDPPAAIPLPAASWALLSGMLALLTLKRRRKGA